MNSSGMRIYHNIIHPYIYNMNEPTIGFGGTKKEGYDFVNDVENHDGFLVP